MHQHIFFVLNHDLLAEILCLSVNDKDYFFSSLAGCIMVLCWVLLTGIGIVSARYGKPLMPKTHFFGLKIWFQIHRCCMAISMCFTILSVLLVIVQAEGYSKIPNIPGKKYQHLHPPLGIVVVVLTIVNPIMALFRPGPETVGRPVFNWAHWAVGVVAQVIAVIAMFIGMDLPKAGVGAAPMIVLAVYVVFVAAFIATMELLPGCLKVFTVKQTRFELSPNLNLRRGSHKEYDVTAPTPTNPPPTAPVPVVSQPRATTQQENRIKCILLLIHFIVTGILAITMMALLAMT